MSSRTEMCKCMEGKNGAATEGTWSPPDGRITYGFWFLLCRLFFLNYISNEHTLIT